MFAGIIMHFWIHWIVSGMGSGLGVSRYVNTCESLGSAAKFSIGVQSCFSPVRQGPGHGSVLTKRYKTLL